MAVWGLIAFWLVIGLAVFFAAFRGRSTPDRPRGGAGGSGGGSNPLSVAGSIFVIAAFGIALPAVVLARGGEDRAKQAPGGVDLSSAEAHGRELFAQNCSTCHALRAANAVGRVGPNLDQLRPPKALVLDAIAKGRARGQGQMPALLLVGEDAKDVAAFVAATAGR
jgi:mono/diheme cytochrome c family protein